jgi:DNA-binding NtrC family response regulator
LRILVIDDDKLISKAISDFLKYQLNHEVTVCDNALEGEKIFSNSSFPMIISDIRMPGMDGFTLTKKIKDNPDGKDTDIVLITGHTDTQSILGALRAGAYDYLSKPIDLEELVTVISKVEDHQKLLKENTVLRNKFDEKVQSETALINDKLKKLQYAYAEVSGIGKVGIFSEEMKQVTEMAKKLHGDSTIPVLIQGDSGTGKEIIARMIHYGDNDFGKPFVSLNCASITPTLFESELFGHEAGAFTGSSRKGQMGKMELSNGGTLFLDEIGELPLEMQPKLLKALQDREIYRVGGSRKIPLNFRLICATNCKLEKGIEENRFRLDLFYRINKAKIAIPTLQQRKEDILPLARMFLEEFARLRKQPVKILTKEATMVLLNYDWPGNVRQLQNTMEQAAFLSNDDLLNADRIKSMLDKKMNSTDSSDSLSISFPEHDLSLYDIEKKVVEKILAKFEGNKTKTASYLKISINKVRRIIGDL